MKAILGLFALLLVIALAIAFFQKNPNLIKSPFVKTPSVTIDKQTFSLLIAKTGDETQIGLSKKTSIPQNQGMIFIFPKPDYYSFWMKDMKFPIDIIYINNNKIATIIPDAQPPKSQNESLPIFKPDEPADKVLEINAGLSKKYNFKKGDEVKFENL
ncbi:MAG: DUF192 domain-containing protein [Candidatus Levybacteria bacterium]|nr:DUF192 domain-containing protein [Candidatus Levybacteria bacterium]